MCMHRRRSRLSKEVIYAYGRYVLLAMNMNMNMVIIRSERPTTTSRAYEVMKGVQGGKEAFEGGFDGFRNVEFLDF